MLDAVRRSSIRAARCLIIMINCLAVQSVRTACGRRQPPRPVNLHGFGFVASLVNTLPKWPRYTTGVSEESPSELSLTVCRLTAIIMILTLLIQL